MLVKTTGNLFLKGELSLERKCSKCGTWVDETIHLGDKGCYYCFFSKTLKTNEEAEAMPFTKCGKCGKEIHSYCLDCSKEVNIYTAENLREIINENERLERENEHLKEEVKKLRSRVDRERQNKIRSIVRGYLKDHL